MLVDKELDTQTHQMLEGKNIDQRLTEFLTNRAQERSITLANTMLSLMDIQVKFFTRVAVLKSCVLIDIL